MICKICKFLSFEIPHSRFFAKHPILQGFAAVIRFERPMAVCNFTSELKQKVKR